MKIPILTALLLLSTTIFALDVGQKAPLFRAKNQEGVEFDLKQNEGKTWTILYFYPKAGTAGCTEQAGKFQSLLQEIESKGAKVYGVSTDSVKELDAFQKKYQLTFNLLSDEGGLISSLYGTKMHLVTYSNRHTFIIDPTLTIRHIDRDVNPALDAKKVIDILVDLQKKQHLDIPAK